jgi:hypothetical protein
VRPETGFALFNDDCVFHEVILFQSGLLENTVQSARRNVDIRCPGDGQGSALRLMFELAVTASGSS